VKNRSLILPLLAASLLMACAAFQPVALLSREDSTLDSGLPAVTSTPVIMTATHGSGSAGSLGQAYEMLSPFSLRTGQVIIEVKEFTLAGSILRFGIQARGPTTVLDDPSAPLQPILQDIQILAGTHETPVEIELDGTGGGSSEDGLGGLIVEESLVFRLITPLTAESTQHLVVVVTLNEGFQIGEPVRFTLDAAQ
jgi:hypothetical protein